MKWVFAQTAQNDGVAPYRRAERPARRKHTTKTVSGEPVNDTLIGIVIDISACRSHDRKVVEHSVLFGVLGFSFDTSIAHPSTLICYCSLCVFN